MGPITRSANAKHAMDTSIEKIRHTMDPIQKTFTSDKLPLWRFILHTRYVAGCPAAITADWFDYEQTRNQLSIITLPTPMCNPSPPNLYKTFLQLYLESSKLITITLYHTTGTVLVQGTACRQWVDEEFDKMKTIVSTMSDETTTPAIEPPISNSSSEHPLSTPSIPAIEPPSSDSSISPSQSPLASQPGHPILNAVIATSTPPFTPPLSADFSGPQHLSKSEPLIDTMTSCVNHHFMAIKSTDERGVTMCSEAHPSPPGTATSCTPRCNHTTAAFGPNPPTPCPPSQTPVPGTNIPATSIEPANHEGVGALISLPCQASELARGVPSAEVNTVVVDTPNTQNTTSPSSTSLVPVSDSTAMRLIIALQHQLAESSATITTLHSELRQCRAELQGVKNEFADLKQGYDTLTSLVLDSEVKAKNEIKAVEASVRENIDKTAEALRKSQTTLSEKISKLVSSRDSHTGKLEEICKRLDTWTPSQTKSVRVSTTEHSPTNLSSQNKSPSPPPASGTTPKPHGFHSNNSSEGPTIPVTNRYQALNPEQELDSPGCSPIHKNNDGRPASRRDNENLTPLERLRAMKIRPEVNTLLIGDSVTKYIDEKRMSTHESIMQNLSVSDLRVDHLTQWLNTQPHNPNIRTVTVHIGINSCWHGPISQQTWLKLCRMLVVCFPKARLQMSTLLPTRGRYHPLHKPAYESNKALQAVCKQEKITLIDHTSSFLSTRGAPKQAMYFDKLHPSEHGVHALECNMNRFVRSHLSSGEEYQDTRLYDHRAVNRRRRSESPSAGGGEENHPRHSAARGHAIRPPPNTRNDSQFPPLQPISSPTMLAPRNRGWEKSGLADPASPFVNIQALSVSIAQAIAQFYCQQ